MSRGNPITARNMRPQKKTIVPPRHRQKDIRAVCQKERGNADNAAAAPERSGDQKITAGYF